MPEKRPARRRHSRLVGSLFALAALIATASLMSVAIGAAPTPTAENDTGVAGEAPQRAERPTTHAPPLAGAASMPERKAKNRDRDTRERADRASRMTDPRQHSTRFGAAVPLGSGLSYTQSLDRAMDRYGDLDIVRKFYPGMPAPWSKLGKELGSVPAVVSFKASPQAVLSGRYDSLLRDWFADAPTDRPTYWVYFHEPENDVASHAFTPAQYRAAWRHVSGLADAAHNRQLQATLTLMAWSLQDASHRDWRDYYAGSSYVDVLAWDVYNKAIARNAYGSPESMFARAIEVSRAEGKPAAFAEVGSKLAKGDDGTRRAAWLTAIAKYLDGHDAAFVCYFDSTVGGDFRLLDKPSQRAWQQVVSG